MRFCEEELFPGGTMADIQILVGVDTVTGSNAAYGSVISPTFICSTPLENLVGVQPCARATSATREPSSIVNCTISDSRSLRFLSCSL
jgi:hypothetical protein